MATRTAPANPKNNAIFTDKRILCLLNIPRLLRKQSQAQMPTHKHTQKTQRSCDMSIIIRKLTTSTIINYNNSNNIL